MPYSIERRDGKHCVIKDSDGKSMGCHDTRGEAQDQIAAIEASESKSIFKVYKTADGDYRFIGISSNAYKDRDKDIVSSKALLTWCAMAYKTGDFGDLRLMHSDKHVLGKADAAYFHEPWLLVTGTFEKTLLGQKMGDYLASYDDAFGELGMSIQFHCFKFDRADGVFDFILIEEHTIAPKSIVANPWTPIAVG